MNTPVGSRFAGALSGKVEEIMAENKRDYYEVLGVDKMQTTQR